MNYATKNFFRFLLIILSIAVMYLHFFQLFYPISFWYDEINSVSWAKLPFSDFFKVKLNFDVHPPFYELFLKFWLMFFDYNESSIRFSSFLFVTCGILILLNYIKKNFSEITFYFSVVILLSNIQLIYYSNEARMYGLMFLLSSYLITNKSMIKESKISFSFLFCSLILSLTHYFGLILVFIIFFYIFLLNIKNFENLFKIIIAGLLCLVWPLIHLIYGSLSNKLYGNFWITASFGDSFDFVLALINTFKLINHYKVIIGSLDTFIFFFFILIFIFYQLFNKKLLHHSFIILLIFTSLISIIDNYSPISNFKSYIVLIPSLLIVMCVILETILSKNIFYHKILLNFFLCFIVIVFLIAKSDDFINPELRTKVGGGVHDLKKAYIVLSQNMDNRKYYFYNKFNFSFDYYVNKYLQNKDPLNFNLVKISEISEKSIIFYSQVDSKEYFDLIKSLENFIVVKIYPAEQNILQYSFNGIILVDKLSY